MATARTAPKARGKPDPLSTYRTKRDFTRTSEPKGDPARRSARSVNALRFVVQKHAASRLHFDLRLELGGVMKSWAVTRGPSLDPADKRLAVEVEDHPLDYRTFEGTIDDGYGAGTVMVWDEGTWELAPEIDDAAAALEKGNLKFVLHGSRLKGGWDLVRMKPRPKERQPQWLLFKRRDDEARPGEGGQLVEEATTSITTGRTMEQIAAGKAASTSGKPGAAKATTTRKAAPEPSMPSGTLTGFVPPMLCLLVDRAPEGPGWVHEIKLDGYRVEAVVVGGTARLITRNGHDWTARFPEAAKALSKLPDCILDGELIAQDAHGMPDFAALQAAIEAKSTAGLLYFAFDILALRGEDLRSKPLSERKAILRDVLGKRPPKGVVLVEAFEKPGEALLSSACRLGLEGIVSKRADGPYKSGDRGGDWVKAKCRGGDEFVIGGHGTGTKGRLTLLLGAWRDGKLVYLGRVGSGISEAKERDLLRRLKPLQREDPPFAAAPRDRRGATWVEPKLVAAVDYTGWTADGLLRQASFKALREDKPATDVDVPKAEAAPAPSRKAGPKAAKTGTTVALTHPEKLLWPDDGITKRDLADYYVAIASRLLPQIVGRALSLVRAPDGIGGQKFFQRHASPGMSHFIHQVIVPGEAKPMLAVDSVDGLVALAQAGVVEIHPWGSRLDDVERPDRLILDLDPGEDVPFARVVEAALEMKDRLERLGLVPFCKTTGGKGLHVVVPLTARAEWPEAKAFCKAMAEVMAQDAPNRFTANMAKRARTGRIFIDYLRNDRGSTAVAAWSPRARARATVSMPVSWSEVTAKLDPKAFTLKTKVPTGGRDPWAKLDASTRPLPVLSR